MLHPNNDGIDHINMYTKGKTQLGKMLSNLAEIPIVVNDDQHTNLKLSCMEAYWYLKKIESGYIVGEIPEHPMWVDTENYLKDIKGKNSFEVKKIGRKYIDNAIRKYGIGYDCFIPNDYFKKCILTALANKIKSNKTLLELVENNKLPYAHYYHSYYNPDKIMEDSHRWQTEGIQKICDTIKEAVLESKYSEYSSKVLLANKWAEAYYVNDSPLATDDEYDTLMAEIKLYEAEHPEDIDLNSPTLTVGGLPTTTGFTKAAHGERMWSMEDIFSKEDLQEWMIKTPSAEYVIEPKFDGVSLNLVYSKGKLLSGITRGDGTIGELVTLNAMQISGVPRHIEHMGTLEVRGEVVIPVAFFNVLNKKRLGEGEPLFANPRNVAAGTLRQHDSSIVKKRHLMFIPWGVGKSDISFKSHSEKMTLLEELGFNNRILRTTKLTSIVSDYNGVMDMYSFLLSKRAELNMALDGMVIKVNDTTSQAAYGYTTKYPKWMVAFKFPATEKTSRIESIDIQVGRTGVITPVARITPTTIDGSVVSNVTLHNYAEIARKDLRIGDQVIVVLIGDVIPKILKPLIERRDGTEMPVVKMVYCPACGHIIDHGDTVSKCRNIKCKARVINKLIHFVSRGAMNIVGLGDETIELLYEKGIVTKLEDIYNLTEETFTKGTILEGFQTKKINNLLEGIKESKDVKLSKLIYALGIEKIGEKAALDLSLQLKDKWLYPELDVITSINRFGKEMSNSYVDFINTNRDELLSLIKHLNISYNPIRAIDSIYSGKNVVLTGTFDKPRGVIKGILEMNGAKVTSSVSSKTDYLIYGDNYSSKYDTAMKLGIPCIYYDENTEVPF